MSSQQAIRIHDVVLQPGTRVQGRYEITRHIGAGGFAQVFEAFDDNIERPVAIKFLNLHSTQTDPNASQNILARFKREAKLAAKIQHPNVVNIFDFGVVGEHRNIPYIVMELLSGHDLEEQIFDRGPMTPARALPLFVSCLEALGEAHKMGIVHKDLKPSNLFLANPGQRTESLRIVDFGIAHIRNASEGRLTATGQILGTPQYLAPEYIDSQIVTPAFDVYQMGLILVEALTGKPVVDENHPLRCVKIHSMGELDVPEALLKSDLGPILGTALALEHSDRFENAEVFADRLAEIDPNTVPVVSPESALARLSGAARPNSASRLVSASTGAVQRPQTGELAAGSNQHRVAHQPTNLIDTAPGPETRAAITAAGSLDRSKKVVVILAVLVITLGAVAAWIFSNNQPDDDLAVQTSKATGGDETEPPSADPTLSEPSDDTLPAETASTAASEVAAAITAASQENENKQSANAQEADAPRPTPHPNEARNARKYGPKKPKTISVSVETDPSGATLLLGGKRLGSSPYTISFNGRDADPQRIRLKKPGYYSRTVVLQPDDAPTRFVALDKRQRPSRPATKPAPTPQPETTPEPTPAPKAEKEPPAEEPEDRRMLIAP